LAVPLSYVPNLVSYTIAGKAVGLMLLSQGILLFLNIPLAKLAVITNDGDFFLSNLIIALGVIPCIFAAWRIHVYMKTSKQTQTKDSSSKIEN
jgi:uncharacterized membrane-anchored protein YitT (DUF2179 family)